MLCLLRDHIEVCYAGQDNENFNEESMQLQKFLFNNILYHVGIKWWSSGRGTPLHVKYGEEIFQQPQK